MRHTVEIIIGIIEKEFWNMGRSGEKIIKKNYEKRERKGIWRTKKDTDPIDEFGIKETKNVSYPLTMSIGKCVGKNEETLCIH